MGIVTRQSIKATIATYLAVVIGYLNLGYFFPKIFSTEQIGLISFLLGTSTLLVCVFQMGIPTTIIRFSPVIKKNHSEKSFYSFSLLIPLLVFALVFGTLYLFLNSILSTFYAENELIKNYIYYVPVFTFLIGFTGVFAAHCNSKLRIVIPTIIEKFISRLLILLLIVFVILGWIKFEDFINGYILVYLACFILTYIYFKKLSQDRPNKEKKLTLQNKKEMLRFGAISFLTAIGARIVENIDVIMISSIIDLSNAGIYKIAFYIGGVIMIPLGTIGQISSPLFAQFWETKSLRKIDDLYKKASINLILIGGILFVGVFINLDNIFRVMPNGQDFVKGKWVILIIAIGKLINMGLSLNGHLLQNSKYYYFNTYCIVFLGVLTIITNLIFIPIWGIIGAAFASALSLIIFNLIKFVFILSKFKMHPFSSMTIPAILIILLAVFLNYLFPQIENVFLDIFYRSAIISILYIGIAYYGNISKEFNTQLNKFTFNKLPWKRS